MTLLTIRGWTNFFYFVEFIGTSKSEFNYGKSDESMTPCTIGCKEYYW